MRKAIEGLLDDTIYTRRAETLALIVHPDALDGARAVLAQTEGKTP